MAIKSDAESVKVLPSDNQNITSEAPKLLLCSSIASGSDLGSNEGIMPLAGIGGIFLFQSVFLYSCRS